MTTAHLATDAALDDLLALVQRRDWDALRRSAGSCAPARLAELLFRIEKPERMLLFRALPRELASDAFAHLAPDQKDALLKDLTDDEARQILGSLSPDDRAQVLAELPGAVTQRALNLLSEDDLREARTLLGYPEESVGRLMTPDYVAIRPHWTIAAALEHIRRQGRDSETVNRLYVVDEAWRLVDDVELRKLILADPGTTVEQVMDHAFVSVSASADREAAVALIADYDLVALPVVDSAGVLVGIVTVDDVMDVAEAEATEDFHRIASVEPVRTSLRDASAAHLYKRRIGWLLGLVFVNLFSGAGLAYFEELIAATVALVFFLPLLIASAGNAGSQAAMLMVRAIATGDVRVRDWFQLFGKEVMVATAIGVTMGAAVSLLGWYRGGADVGAVVAMTMVAVVVVGSVVGMSLPFLLDRLGLDPATASAPLVTSIADVSGILVYFSIASWYLT